MKTGPLPLQPCCGVSADRPNTLRALVMRSGNRCLWLARAMFRILTQRRCLDYDVIRQSVRGECGLEIGGPSLVFCRRLGTIPVYGIAARVDACDFSEETVWSSKWTTGFVKLMQPSGLRVVSDGSSLAFKSELYAFVLASDVLEHCANPLKAVAEWRRVLRPGGIMVLSLPHRPNTFDRRRPYTSFDHLKDDFAKDVGETDLTHIDEILALHDLSLDPAAGSWTEFRKRAQRNAQSRCLHHHVFSPELLIDICTWAEMPVLSVSVERPARVIAVASKTQNDRLATDNGRFLQPDAKWRMQDAFCQRSCDFSMSSALRKTRP